ncbi:MAG: hypothetical protein HY075_07355 [Deltaproteobacteria bacterium]|nr:hypothetical protein [Deltaproteobacteria bacterium]
MGWAKAADSGSGADEHIMCESPPCVDMLSVPKECTKSSSDAEFEPCMINYCKSGDNSSKKICVIFKDEAENAKVKASAKPLGEKDKKKSTDLRKAVDDRVKQYNKSVKDKKKGGSAENDKRDPKDVKDFIGAPAFPGGGSGSPGRVDIRE